jgi:NAD(P)-dependent dehydrogenase (short-subunit alcohol dehydrogenase family)
MRGKTIVITGATSGIGEIAALRLAERGARIVLIARDRARAENTLQRLRTANRDAAHTAHYADLTLLGEMRRVALEIAQAEPRIDVLINNAGFGRAGRRMTSDGLEIMFATNHMAYFIITNLLLERLCSTPGARIVSTASAAHRSGKLNPMQFSDPSRIGGYGTSKLCNILFTRELARRLAGTGVTANCLHPGFVATRFGDNTGPILRAIVGLMKRAIAISPEEGAKTIVYLASSPEVANESGGYYFECKRTQPNAAARDDAKASELWKLSAKLAGVG